MIDGETLDLMSGPSPSTLILKGGAVVLPDRLVRDGAVTCAGGRVTAVGPAAAVEPIEGAAVIDAGGGYICPGFVDQHVHGGGGCDFMDGTAAAVETAIRTHTRYGTTSIFPTTTTGTPGQIDAMLSACEETRSRWEPRSGARLAGVHFYGPYFAEEMVGAHPDDGRRDPDAEEYRAAFDRGIVRVATCAAELPGAEDYFRDARRRGYLVTCGHSNASWEEMQRGFDAGLRHVDHFWCAMSSVPTIRRRLGNPMQGSMEQFVLSNDEMSTEVLADGEHLAPELLQFAFRFKGPDRLCLVTDSNRAVDMPAGEYVIGPQATGKPFHNNGKVGVMPNGGLASTVFGMDHMVRHMLAATGAELPEVVRMASLTPARLCGIADEVGSLEAGKRADILILDKELRVRRVFIDGIEFEREK